MPAIVTKVTGEPGEVRVGGRMAARFRNWTWEPVDAASADESWTIVATVVDQDDYWLESDGPFEARVSYMGWARREGEDLMDGEAPEAVLRTWRWKGVTVHIQDSTITVRGTGNPEVL